jgi:hypothetical protein
MASENQSYVYSIIFLHVELKDYKDCAVRMRRYVAKRIFGLNYKVRRVIIAD